MFQKKKTFQLFMFCLKYCFNVFNVLAFFKSFEVCFNFSVWERSPTEFASDRFIRNKSPRRVSNVHNEVRACRSRWPVLPLPRQTLSLTNRCRAAEHAVMLLPKHFNELTWPYVSCRFCIRDVTDTITIRLPGKCDYRIYQGLGTLFKTSRFMAYAIHSRTK